MNFYNTQQQVSNKIYALSDIHGDLHSFIISLRDCAEVIKKDTFDSTILDPDLEKYLNMDISLEDGDYDDSLGYEWSGSDSFVIICGDIIDPHRSEACKKLDNKYCSQYPQIEIKLLRFINTINRQAKTLGGKIYKLLGNHELSNILTPTLLKKNIYQSDLQEKNYYRGNTRIETFKVGNEGFKLLFQDNCGVLLKINDTIYVHAGIDALTQNIEIIDMINQFINNPGNQTKSFIPQWKDNFKLIHKQDYDTGPLWNRETAYDEHITSRITAGTEKDFCEGTLLPNLRTFLNQEDVSNVKMIIGHCPQFYSTIFQNSINITGDHLFYETTVSEYYSSKTIHKGTADLSNNGRIFGITMQCIKNPNVEFPESHIYHIDVGSSRGFDFIDPIYLLNPNLELSKNELEKRFYFSKTPQILYIYRDNNIDVILIIKSKMKNTRIHLPRPQLEHYVSSEPSLATLKLDSGNYNKKYLKYKTKYLILKKILSK
jgi:hypothetical protein